MPLPRPVGLSEAAEGSEATPAPIKKAASAAAPQKAVAPAAASTTAPTATSGKKVAVMAKLMNADEILAAATLDTDALERQAFEYTLALKKATPAQRTAVLAIVPDELKPYVADIPSAEAVSMNGSAPTPSAPATPPSSSEGKGELVKKDEEFEAYKKDGMVSVYNGDQMVVSVPEDGYAKNPAFNKAFKKTSGNLLGRFNF